MTPTQRLHLAYFDAHNHVHLSMPGRIPPVISPESYSTSQQLTNDRDDDAGILLIQNHADVVARDFAECASRSGSDCADTTICGLSLMSTQPRDFIPVTIMCRELEKKLSLNPTNCVPSFGVHPWFLHLAEQDANAYTGTTSSSVNNTYIDCKEPSSKFWWEEYMRQSLLDNPGAAVGEIGLDGARYDPTTGNLYTAMDRQVDAFELQLRLAVELKRVVSIHAVRAWGPLLDTLNKKFGKKKGDKPPRMYFHAFGGKPSVVNQINAACMGTEEVFYGFAPCVNFRSRKTADVVRAVGIDSLLLETDREDYRQVKRDLEADAEYIGEALGMTKIDVIETTTANARRFYGI